MERIERIGDHDNRRICRHCKGRKAHFNGLWGTFFNGLDDNLFDHLSYDKFWFITEPYNGGGKLKKFDRWLKMYGASLFYIYPGYHYEDVTTMIVVPDDLVRFSARINNVLDSKNKYDTWIKFGGHGEGSFDKAYVRNVIRNFHPPSVRECMISAMSYLTWMDRSYPYVEFARISEYKVIIGWDKFIAHEMVRQHGIQA